MPYVKFGKPAPKFVGLIKKKTPKIAISDEKNLVHSEPPKC